MSGCFFLKHGVFKMETLHSVVFYYHIVSDHATWKYYWLYYL